MILKYGKKFGYRTDVRQAVAALLKGTCRLYALAETYRSVLVFGQAEIVHHSINTTLPPFSPEGIFQAVRPTDVQQRVLLLRSCRSSDDAGRKRRHRTLSATDR